MSNFEIEARIVMEDQDKKIAQLKATMDSFVAVDKARREEVTKLQAENDTLRSLLKPHYSDWRVEQAIKEVESE